MKTTILLKIYYLSLLQFGLLFHSSSIAQNVESKEFVNLPCKEFSFSTNTYLRSDASAIDSDKAISEEKALLISKHKLASQISLTISSYSVVHKVESDSTIHEDYEEIIRSIVSQEITEVEIICNKHQITDNGLHQTFIAIQVSKQSVLDKLSDSHYFEIE